MARPTKQGIDYFPVDVEFDDKTKLYVAEKEAFGLAVLVTAWQLIYRESGYYAMSGDDFALSIKLRISGDINAISDCLNTCLRRNLFDKRLHERYGILTARGIQRRYFEVCRKRRAVEYVEEFLLVPITGYLNLVKVGINGVNVAGNSQAAGLIPLKGAETPQAAGLIPLKGAETPQSKVKESKVKELHCEGTHQKPDAHPSRDTAVGILEFLNQKTGKNYRAFEGLNGKRKPTANLELILARLGDGKTDEDLRGVIARKVREWKGDAQMAKYLRPATLFNRTKCEQYVGEQEGAST